ncbi:MAG: glycosyltransferase, partial [Clostridia bacterium]|nr:glycosyltransferase [Clostridia bacterium]
MRVLLCGGGTAGHVNPAIAIGETIIKNLPESKIAYVATLKGIENELVHFKKYHINVSGLKKGISISNFKSLYRMLVAEEKCKEIIKEFCPDVIIGTGGYATYPVI